MEEAGILPNSTHEADLLIPNQTETLQENYRPIFLMNKIQKS